MKTNKPYYLLLYPLFFILLIIFLPDFYQGDQGFWKHWCIQIFENGLGNIYHFKLFGQHPVNYHPLYLYFLKIFGWIQGSKEAIVEHLNYLKLVPLTFDFIGILGLVYLAKRTKRHLLLPLLLLLNIAYVYNSIYWGQVDAIHTTLVLLSVLFLFRYNVLLSGVFYLLAINMKLQAIIFAPLLFLIALPVIRKSYRKLLYTIPVLLLVQLLILIPFIQAETLGKLVDVVFGAVDFYPVVSKRAFNLWYLIFGEQSKDVSDAILFAGLSYKLWGLILFAFSSGLALLVVLIKVVQQKIDFDADDPRFFQLVFLTGTIIAISFFFFNTQMHSRYSHPCIIFSFAFGMLSRRYLIHILCSIAYFLNMENGLHAFKFSNYNTFIFDPRPIAGLYLVALLICFYYLRKLKD